MLLFALVIFVPYLQTRPLFSGKLEKHFLYAQCRNRRDRDKDKDKKQNKDRTDKTRLKNAKSKRPMGYCCSSFPQDAVAEKDEKGSVPSTPSVHVPAHMSHCR